MHLIASEYADSRRRVPCTFRHIMRLCRKIRNAGPERNRQATMIHAVGLEVGRITTSIVAIAVEAVASRSARPEAWRKTSSDQSRPSTLLDVADGTLDDCVGLWIAGVGHIM